MTHDFLPDRDPIRWTPPEGFPKRMKPLDMFFQLAADGGHIPHGLEVVTARSSRRPTAADLRSSWSKRKAGRASPVLMIVFYYERGGDQNYASDRERSYESGEEERGGGERVSVCGPVGAQPAVHHSLDVERVERIADCALSEPNRHSAVRFLAAALPEADSPFPGLRNVGLLSTQELRYGVPRRKGWRGAVERAAPLCSLRGRQLVEALGFGVEMLDVNSWMLTAPYQGHEQGLPAGEGRAGGDAAGGGEATPPAGAEASPTPSEDRLATAERRAVAVFCRDDEQFEAPSGRFNAASPVSRALAVADREEVDWVILTRASEIRLYAARRDTGVGRKGRAESFVEANLSLLPKKQAGYLPLLFSADALSPEGTFEDILERSHDYAARLAKRLRERVYREVVPALAQAVADRMPPNPSQEALADAYEQVMVILFRLLFVAYAEDKDLLPYRTNSTFAERSLSQMARRLSDARREGRLHLDNNSTALWDNVVDLWDAVNNGKEDWGVPVYNGGLFASDRLVSPAGAAIAKMRLTDAEFAPALDALLTEEGREGLGPIDFRELSAREFGTIYEGLLESSLSLAAEDLTLDRKDTYVPAKEGDEVAVKAGKPYLHNRSGVRKETGSYFTKPFAVEHLLDHALEPALDEHLRRLDELRAANDEAALAEAFFDFRCADIAMGSGHFLVAALDRIEAKLSAWLTLHPLAAITKELERLRENAYKALGDLGAGVEIESSSLLRRQVARHCIYGVDLNPIAVELARLAVWVHTFVPGLPLSFLDHNLVCGDSLTGVGGLDEVVSALDPDSAGGGADAPSLFRGQVEDLLHRADHALRRLARTSDANKKEIEEARIAHSQALQAVSGARAVCDLITAHRAGVGTLPEKFDEAIFVGMRSASEVEEAIGKFNPLHFPVVFPEVFLRDRPGFDCLLGNPPWEQVVVAEQVWWGLHLPGIRGLPIQKMNAEIRKLRNERSDLEVLFQQACVDSAHLRDLLRGTFLNLGSGRTDLYKAFCWRNWQLMGEGAITGMVLPRAVLQTKGSEAWREAVLNGGSFTNVITLLNTGGWVSEDIHRQFAVSLTVFQKKDYRDSNAQICFGGPFTSREAFSYKRSTLDNVPLMEFLSWSDDCSFPQLPDHPGALNLFRKLRLQPRLNERTSERANERTSERANERTSERANERTSERANERTSERANERTCASLPDHGSSVQFKGTSTPRPTSTDSSSTLALPPGRGIPCHSGQAQIHPRFRCFRPVRELDATFDKEKLILDEGVSAIMGINWPVFKGESLDIWEPDRRKYYASADPDVITRDLQIKRKSQHRKSRSAFSEFDLNYISDPSTLPCYQPRIAFRNITNSTDSRTVVTALVPPEVVIVNHAPYLLRIKGNAKDEAFLLGILSSMILDWYARRIVVLNLNFHLLNNFPIPRPDVDNNPVARRVVKISGRLAAVDERFADWAADVGVEVGTANDSDIKQDLIHELDACVAHLYDLDEADLAVVYETFHAKTDYSERHAAVLEHFRRWAPIKQQYEQSHPDDTAGDAK